MFTSPKVIDESMVPFMKRPVLPEYSNVLSLRFHSVFWSVVVASPEAFQPELGSNVNDWDTFAVSVANQCLYASVLVASEV